MTVLVIGGVVRTYRCLKHPCPSGVSLSLSCVAVPKVWRSVGWRVIALSVSLYGLLYLYEKLTWTDVSMERALKQQFVEHAARRLRTIVPVSSSACSQQVYK